MTGPVVVLAPEHCPYLWGPTRSIVIYHALPRTSIQGGLPLTLEKVAL